MMASRSSLLFIGLTLLLAITGLYMNSQRGLLADDDNLWLHFTAEKITAPATGQAMEDRAASFISAEGASDASVRRLTERSRYLYNYALPVLAWNGLLRLLPPPSSADDYPAYIAAALNFMLLGTSLATWFVFMAIALRWMDARLRLPVLASLSLIAALMLLPNSPPMMTLLGFSSLEGGLRNFAAFVLNPWHGASLFSFTPRNNFAVLVLALFLLRWSGRMRASYLLLLPLYGVHSSLSLLVAVHLVALDLLRQRSALRDPVILGAIVLGIAYGLWRETLWSFLGASALIPAILAILLMLLLWAIYAPRPLLGLERLGAGLAQKLDALPLPTAEALLLCGFWLASVLPVWLISQHMDALQNQYFWHQLQGRAIGAMGPVVFTGFMVCLASHWQKRLIALCLAIWLAGFAWHAATRPTPYAIAHEQAVMHENYLSGRMAASDYKYLSGPGFVLSEPVLYYALGQMMVMKNDRWADLQRTALPGGR